MKSIPLISRSVTWTRTVALPTFLVGTGMVLAQVDTGTITGTVKDPSQSPVAGATIFLHNQDTGLDTSVTTNASGQYVSPPLRPAPYTVKVEMQGFQTQVTPITLELNQRAVVDFSLRIGAINQTV